MCGNAVWDSQYFRNVSVANCLLELQWWEELRAFSRVAIADVFSGSPCFVEKLIESYHREGRVEEIDADLAAIRSTTQNPSDLALSVAHWEILHLPDEQAFRRIPALLHSDRFEHFARVDELFQQAGPEGVRYWTNDLDRRRTEWTFDDLRLLHRLADTGDSNFGDALNRWLESESDSERHDWLVRVEESWAKAARAR
jgi:hypothetical protein